MAKISAEERRLLRVGKAERAAARARQCRREADYAERGGRHAEAADLRAVADRHEGFARQHAQEVERMAERARARAYQSEPKAKARQALRAAAPLRTLASDCLDWHRAALAEIEAIEAEIRRLAGVLSRLPSVGAETQRARLQAQIAAHEGWALEWKREAGRIALASKEDFNQTAGIMSGEAHSP